MATFAPPPHTHIPRHHKCTPEHCAYIRIYVCMYTSELVYYHILSYMSYTLCILSSNTHTHPHPHPHPHTHPHTHTHTHTPTHTHTHPHPHTHTHTHTRVHWWPIEYSTYTQTQTSEMVVRVRKGTWWFWRACV